jgi:hypothetical protein
MPRENEQEQIKKNISKERQNKEMEQFHKEEQIKAAVLTASLDAPLLEEPPSMAKEDRSHFNLKPVLTDDDAWKKILADYKKLYPGKSVENNMLSFETENDAIKFFTAQATNEPPGKFLVSEVDQNGKQTGMNLFSCGNSKLYKGSLKDIHRQLQDDLKQNPDDPNIKQGLNDITRLINPTSEYRTVLQQAKDSEPKEAVDEQIEARISKSI